MENGINQYLKTLVNFFMREQSYIYSLQFGFRQKYSTVYALLALLKLLEKIYVNEILVAVFLSTYRKHLILLNMIFFYQSLNITVHVVLLMIGLNLISQVENNMF